LLGHSDADVLLHALADALLGAMAAGDLGRHFPDTDPACKDMSSIDIIRKVLSLVKADGWRVGNVDATVILEEPRLSPYIRAMVVSIASQLAVEEGQVSVKAKTNEQMGFVGRGEGIVALAVVLLIKEEE
jgi:2-C-methyl-D-erythritol 2,4-cyclodiphosphate synthase